MLRVTPRALGATRFSRRALCRAYACVVKTPWWDSRRYRRGQHRLTKGSVHAQMLISNPALTSSNKLFVKTSSYFPKQTLLRFSGLFSFQSIRCHSPMQLSRPIWIYRSQFSLKPYKAGIGLNVSPGSKTQELKRVCWEGGKGRDARCESRWRSYSFPSV